jgi:short-subunit dehydrogenase
MSGTVLAGRHALVTGASGGLGADFARELARRGSNLTLVARRKNLLEELAEELAGGHGVEVTPIGLDLTAPGAPEALAGQVPNVDVVVNNAGYGLFGVFRTIPWAASTPPPCSATA